MKTTYHLGIMPYSSHDPPAAIVKLVQNGTKIDCSFILFEEGSDLPCRVEGLLPYGLESRVELDMELWRHMSRVSAVVPGDG